MTCRDCFHFHEALEKFLLDRKLTVFKCPATREESFAQWDHPCMHFGPVQADDDQYGDHALPSHAQATP